MPPAQPNICAPRRASVGIRSKHSIEAARRDCIGYLKGWASITARAVKLDNGARGISRGETGEFLIVALIDPTFEVDNGAAQNLDVA